MIDSLHIEPAAARRSDPPRLTYAEHDDPWLKRSLINAIERFSGREHLQGLYRRLYEVIEDDDQFWSLCLELLDIELDIDPVQVARIPREGPVIFLSNHPFGVLDGLILCWLTHRTRQRFKILVNSVLCQEPRVIPFLLPIDFEESREAMKTNIRTKQQALATLRDGGTVVIFPSGGVATAVGGGFGRLEDLEWKTFAAKLIQQSRATVVPVFFHGRNSRLFQLVSQVSMTLRLSLLMHEVRNKMGRVIRVSVGDPVPWSALSAFGDRQRLTDHLRALTLGLGGVHGSRERIRRRPRGRRSSGTGC